MHHRDLAAGTMKRSRLRVASDPAAACVAASRGCATAGTAGAFGMAFGMAFSHDSVVHLGSAWPGPVPRHRRRDRSIRRARFERGLLLHVSISIF